MPFISFHASHLCRLLDLASLDSAAWHPDLFCVGAYCTIKSLASIMLQTSLSRPSRIHKESSSRHFLNVGLTGSSSMLNVVRSALPFSLRIQHREQTAFAFAAFGRSAQFC